MTQNFNDITIPQILENHIKIHPFLSNRIGLVHLTKIELFVVHASKDFQLYEVFSNLNEADQFRKEFKREGFQTHTNSVSKPSTYEQDFLFERISRSRHLDSKSGKL